MNRLILFVNCVFAVAILTLVGCAGDDSKKEVVEEVKTQPAIEALVVPKVNGDSAYAFVKQQVDFGPRIPGTKPHNYCADWLELKLRSYIPEVKSQRGIMTTFDNNKFELRNIIASYKPELTKRILLCAHWDTRPFADRDDGANKDKKFDGANDGASGVGVLLEIARQLSIAQPEIGVDIILFDLEDYGQPESSKLPPMKDSWCLGAQYWAKNLHKPGYYAKYGILLDMVGAKGAVFPKEGNSVYFAPSVVDKVWDTASKLGYGNFFINAESSGITDDHVYVNQIANIPCVVIIHYDIINSDFFEHHHRVTDNMEQIDPAILQMVGQTVMQVVMEESVNP